MNARRIDDAAIDVALQRLPEWEAPPGFAARVAAIEVAPRPRRPQWTPLLLRGLGIAACVSVAAWLGAELLLAGLESAAVPGTQAGWSWTLGLGSLLLAWQLVRRPSLFRV
jgi:hypothetical protein